MLSVIASCSDGQNESNRNDRNNWPITNKFDPFEEFGIPNSRHFRIILPDPNIRFISAPQLGTRRSTRIAEKLVTKKSNPNGPSKRAAESSKKANRGPIIQKKKVSAPTAPSRRGRKPSNVRQQQSRDSKKVTAPTKSNPVSLPSRRGRKPSKQAPNVHQQKSRDQTTQKKKVSTPKKLKSRDSKVSNDAPTKSNPASSPSRRGRKPSKQASNVHQQKSRDPKAPKKSPMKKKKAADKIIPQSCIATTRPKRNVPPINRFHF